jgi:hypothetical protein
MPELKKCWLSTKNAVNHLLHRNDQQKWIQEDRAHMQHWRGFHLGDLKGSMLSSVPHLPGDDFSRAVITFLSFSNNYPCKLSSILC